MTIVIPYRHNHVMVEANPNGDTGINISDKAIPYILEDMTEQCDIDDIYDALSKTQLEHIVERFNDE